MTRSTISRIALAASLLAFAGGCMADVDQEGGIFAGEHVAPKARRSTAAPTTGACIDCGCVYEHAGTKDGCDVYDCVCSTVAEAECVVAGGPSKTVAGPSFGFTQPASWSTSSLTYAR